MECRNVEMGFIVVHEIEQQFSGIISGGG